MDGTSPTYEELLDLTRRQAGMIETLRAEVERLKKVGKTGQVGITGQNDLIRVRGKPGQVELILAQQRAWSQKDPGGSLEEEQRSRPPRTGIPGRFRRPFR